MENRIVDSIEIEDAGAELVCGRLISTSTSDRNASKRTYAFSWRLLDGVVKPSTTYCSVVPRVLAKQHWHILLRELGSKLRDQRTTLEKKGDLAGILTNLEEHDVLFIDEIHRLSAVVEENLYPAMEDLRFDVVVGDGVYARSVPIELRPFTLVGATTRADQHIAHERPLRSG